MGNCNTSPYNDSSTSVEVVDVETLNSIHNGSILGMVSSNKDCCFYTCSDDKRIAKISFSQFEGINKWMVQDYLEGHKKSVNRICINDDNTILWSAARDLSLKQWNISDDEIINSSNKCLQTLDNAHTLNIADVTMNKKGDKMFSGSRDYTVKIWDTTVGKCISEFKAPRNVVTCLSIDAINDTLLYQGSEDLCVRVWDVRSFSRQPVMHMNDYVYFPISMCIHSSNHYLATGCKGFNSTGCELKLMDLRKAGNVVTDYKGHSQDVTGCKFYDDCILSCSKDGSVYIWGIDESTHQITTTYKNKIIDDKLYTGISLIRDDSKLNFVVSSFDGSIAQMSYNKALNKLSSTILSKAYFTQQN